MLVLLVFLGSTIGAIAQNYPVAVGETATITHASRSYTGITLQPERGVKQTINVKEGKYVYNDMTSTANGTFTAKVGQTVAARFVATYSNWMHSFIFIDKGNDGQFNVTSLQNANDDLFEFGRFGDRNGKQPLINSIPTFSLPTTAGTYRMRYLVYWSSASGSDALSTTPIPAGNTGMIADGGVVVDVNLQVLAIDVNFVDSEGNALEGGSYETAPVCGQAFTFSVPNKSGYAASVSVKCGANFSESQTSETISWYTSTTLSGATTTQTNATFYNWEQFTPTDNGNGTYTVPADKMKGDLQITVTYSKDVMALIKAGKQVFRLKNRSASTYLMADHVDATTNTGKVNTGTDILYNAALDANNACQLWRLKAGQADNTYYLCSQGLQAGSIGAGDGVVVKMVERGTLYKLWNQTINSTTYYGFSNSTTTSNTTNNFLHAIDYGKTKNDGNYPQSRKGDYVVSWNFSSGTTASHWTFEAVDEIDITIGSSGYASVNYDFPVKFPAGVKVYKKELEATTYIKLEEIPAGSDGCVSLHTGNAAFVAGTEGASITLSILSDEPDNIDTGVNGTYLATKFEEGDAANIYGIAKVNDVVAFYKMQGGTTIKQNKGYIRSTSSNAPRMELTFGEGETTGIESVLEDNSRRESIDTSVLYDLNGRRVLYPSRGIYVTAGGQRIFLK